MSAEQTAGYEYLLEQDGLSSPLESGSLARVLKNPEKETNKLELTVWHDGICFPVLLTTRPGATRCVVLLNGAVDLSRKTGREYQRSSWCDGIRAHVINMPDPTLQLRSDVALGWGQGTLEHHYIRTMSEISIALTTALEVHPEQRTYFGSSAGGYQALGLAALDPGSRAFVNNPQTDWTSHFHQSHVLRLLQVSFAGMNLDKLRSNYPERTNAVDFYESCENVPETLFWVNSAFEHDVTSQLMPYLDKITKLSDLMVNAPQEVHLYSRPDQGHNPLFKVETLKILNEFLDRR